MKMLVPLVFALTLMGGFRQQSIAPQQNAPAPVFVVSGSGWHSCADWKNSTSGFKLGYIIGHVEARGQITQILGSIPGANQAKKSFEPPAGLRMGDYERSLDDFCGDSYNSRIALTNAMGFVSSRLVGGLAADEKTLATLRCLGAAGDDADKIGDCYKRQ